MSSIRVRAVRLVAVTDAPGQQAEPVSGSEPMTASAATAIPAEPLINHGRPPSSTSLPIRFCFEPGARQASQTAVYRGMPDSRGIEAASTSNGPAQGTRLEWKLQPDGELEVLVGPARTDEATGGAAGTAQDMAQTDMEHQKSEAPDATSSGGGTLSRPSQENVNRALSLMALSRSPVSFQVTIGSISSVVQGSSSAAVPDEPVMPDMMSLPEQRPLPVLIVTHSSSAENFAGEHPEEQQPAGPYLMTSVVQGSSSAAVPDEPVMPDMMSPPEQRPLPVLIVTHSCSAENVAGEHSEEQQPAAPYLMTSVVHGSSSSAVMDEPVMPPEQNPPEQPSLPVFIVRRSSSAEIVTTEPPEEQGPAIPCPDCVEELANRIVESGSNSCRLHVVTRSASTNARPNTVREVRSSLSLTGSLEAEF